MGLIDDVPTCENLLDSIVKEAHDIITNRLDSMIVK